MKVIYCLSFLGLMLAGCSSTSSTPTKCTDISNQTVCASSKFASGGCYYAATTAGAAGPTGCIQASNCEQPTTETACKATSVVATTGASATTCSWNGSACYLSAPTGLCSSLSGGKDVCETSSTTEGTCYWTGTACAKATACANLKSQPICALSSFGTPAAACKWTPTPAACTLSSSVLCTYNEKAGFTVSKACCAGEDNTCKSTDANCVLSGTTCLSNPDAKCTVNTAGTACCSGTDTSCTSTNANCTYVDTAGSCA